VTDKVRLISDFDELQTASVNFIGNDLFELKLRKLTNKATSLRKLTNKATSGTTQSLAQVSLVKEDTDSRTQVNIQQELTDEKAEQTLISASKVNNMTRKDYIINFKDIIGEFQFLHFYFLLSDCKTKLLSPSSVKFKQFNLTYHLIYLI